MERNMCSRLGCRRWLPSQLGVRLEERLRLRRKRTSGEQAAGVKEAIEEQELGAARFEVSDGDDEERRGGKRERRIRGLRWPWPSLTSWTGWSRSTTRCKCYPNRAGGVNRRAPSSDVVAGQPPLLSTHQTPQDGHRSDSTPQADRRPLRTEERCATGAAAGTTSTEKTAKHEITTDYGYFND